MVEASALFISWNILIGCRRLWEIDEWRRDTPADTSCHIINWTQQNLPIEYYAKSVFCANWFLRKCKSCDSKNGKKEWSCIGGLPTAVACLNFQWNSHQRIHNIYVEVRGRRRGSVSGSKKHLLMTCQTHNF